MYSQVFTEFAAAQDAYSDLSILPTRVFFHGMEAGEEFAIEMDKGKTLLVSYTAISEPDEEGKVTVFFELNGQPRPVRISDLSRTPLKPERPKADITNPAHIAAPMPGLVVTVSVKPGDKVRKGDVILSLEAMKMQTSVAAERDGVVKQVTVAAGTQVDAKDLVAIIE
jgi:pyruvate carboxylase